MSSSKETRSDNFLQSIPLDEGEWANRARRSLLSLRICSLYESMLDRVGVDTPFTPDLLVNALTHLCWKGKLTLRPAEPTQGTPRVFLTV